MGKGLTHKSDSEMNLLTTNKTLVSENGVLFFVLGHHLDFLIDIYPWQTSAKQCFHFQSFKNRHYYVIEKKITALVNNFFRELDIYYLPTVACNVV